LSSLDLLRRQFITKLLIKNLVVGSQVLFYMHTILLYNGLWLIELSGVHAGLHTDPGMDFFHSREKRHGKRAGLFGHKSASKSNPSSPPHLAEGRSQPTTHFGMKRSESEYAFPISDEQTTHWKPQQQASERIPNSHQRPPVYRYSTPERPREPDEDVTPRSNGSGSPFRSARTRTVPNHFCSFFSIC
jgi:hypothetical protein